MAVSRSATLISRLLRSRLNSQHFIPARSFRATAVTAGPPKDTSGDDPQAEGSSQAEDVQDAVDTFYKKTGKVVNDFKAHLKGMYPEADCLFVDLDDSEKLNDNLLRMLSNLKRRIKSQNPELAERYCEMLHWHPFQEAGNERPYEVNVNEGNWSARIDMPGIGSKGVRVWFENNNLHFKGEEKDKGPAGRKYISKFHIPPGEFNTDEISAALNNGVLNIVIPRIKASKNENSDKE